MERKIYKGEVIHTGYGKRGNNCNIKSLYKCDNRIHHPPAEDLLEADGRLADDILSLDLAEPCPLSLEGGVGCFISGTSVLLVGGARPP